MLYVTLSPRAGSSWGLGARLYMRSLALASAKAELPFRLLWTAACAINQAKSGATVQSFADVLDPSSLPPALQALRPHFGPGANPAPASCMLFVGEVPDAVERISHPDECPAKNVALTSWPASTLPPHLAVRLSAYDLVLVPEGEGQTFVNADVPYVVEVPWPAPTQEECARAVQAPPKGLSRVLCAAGSWGEPDGVGRIADTFVEVFNKQDGVGLLLMCNDVPRQWVKDVVLKHGKPRERLPFVTVLDTYGLWDDPSAVDRALLVSHAFVDASRRVGPSFWAQRAASLGCPIVHAFAASVSSYQGGPLWPGVTPAQAWRDTLPLGEMSKLLLSPSRAERAVAAPGDPAHAGQLIAALIKRVVAGEAPGEMAERTRPPATVGKAPEPRTASDGIGVVVPFGGANVEGLRRCLEALLAAKRAQDRIVVSARGEPAAVVSLCEALRVPCVHSTSGGERWNMSAVRNAGARFFQEAKSAASLALVAFVDADVVVPPDYLKRLAREAYKRPGLVLTPYVADDGEAAKTRIASGMSVYPLDLLLEARGFDEAYVGWGHEDLDLLHRLREMHGVAAVPLTNTAPAIHTPHPPRAGDEQQRRDHEANLARYEAVAKRLDAGGKVEVNKGDWGTFAILANPGEC